MVEAKSVRRWVCIVWRLERLIQLRADAISGIILPDPALLDR
ncbi:MAG: hypothetical protein ABSC93_20675 [Bryobacteraceae bacterium]|jgi:hypothetical protein